MARISNSKSRSSMLTRSSSIAVVELVQFSVQGGGGGGSCFPGTLTSPARTGADMTSVRIIGKSLFICGSPCRKSLNVMIFNQTGGKRP